MYTDRYVANIPSRNLYKEHEQMRVENISPFREKTLGQVLIRHCIEINQVLCDGRTEGRVVGDAMYREVNLRYIRVKEFFHMSAEWRNRKVIRLSGYNMFYNILCTYLVTTCIYFFHTRFHWLLDTTEFRDGRIGSDRCIAGP